MCIRDSLTALPEDLSKLKNLEVLEIGRNQLETPLPQWLGELENLRELNIAGCGGDANVPAGIANLRKLEILIIDASQVLPYEIGRGNSRLQVIVR